MNRQLHYKHYILGDNPKGIKYEVGNFKKNLFVKWHFKISIDFSLNPLYM